MEREGKARQRSSHRFGGAKFVQFLAALAVLPQSTYLEVMNEFKRFFQIDRDKTARAARN